MREVRVPRLRGYLFAAPLLAVLGLAVLYPALYNLAIAFFKVDLARNSWTFVGFRNFAKLWESEFFWNAFGVTLIWVGGNVSLQFVVGLSAALALNSIRRFREPTPGRRAFALCGQGQLDQPEHQERTPSP